MNLNDLLMMRNELLLTVSALMLICVDLLASASLKRQLVLLACVSLFLTTILSFFPGTHGQLFGGMYNSSQLTQVMKAILNIGTLIVLLQSWDWLLKEDNQGVRSEYLMLILSTLIGMSFMISAGHFLMFYLGLELATIPIAGLVAFEKYKTRSSEAGIKFILLAALSSGIMLYGLSMIYGLTGSMYFVDVARVYSSTSLHVLAFLFFFAGLGFKISLVPFHLWTADVYEGAPINVSSFLSVISKSAAVFILMIILATVFQSIITIWVELSYVLAILTMTIGNIFAIRQQNLKRFLAFSSIAQAGFLLLGVLSASQLGMASVIFFALVYIFSNLAAFGVVSTISNATNKETIDDYNGLYSTNPKLSLALMLALFSLAGIPPASGFFAKLFLFSAVAEKGYIGLLLIATLNATVSLYYYLLVVKAMFINKSESPIQFLQSSTATRVGLSLCVGGILLLGFASAIFNNIFSMSFGVHP